MFFRDPQINMILFNALEKKRLQCQNQLGRCLHTGLRLRAWPQAVDWDQGPFWPFRSSVLSTDVCAGTLASCLTPGTSPRKKLSLPNTEPPILAVLLRDPPIEMVGVCGPDKSVGSAPWEGLCEEV